MKTRSIAKPYEDKMFKKADFEFIFKVAVGAAIGVVVGVPLVSQLVAKVKL